MTLFNIIEKHQGCNYGEACFGPVGQFYTVFGTEFRHLTKHLIVAIASGLILFGSLYLLRKKIKLPVYLSVIISIMVTVLLFLLFAYLFPVVVMY